MRLLAFCATVVVHNSVSSLIAFSPDGLVHMGQGLQFYQGMDKAFLSLPLSQ